MKEELRYWVGFGRAPGIGAVRLSRLLDHFGGDIRKAWETNAATLGALGLDRRTIETFLEHRESIDLDLEMNRLEELGVTVLTLNDEEYPQALKKIENPPPPPVLYVRGEILPHDEWALGVVGTRKASAYGKEVTRRLVTDLAAGGLTIVSGLAVGVDSEAHKAALEAGGRTVAVLGCGVDVTYPPQNRRLSDEITQNGAVISEYPLGTKPAAGNFPQRNRIISGMSMGLLVVEAGEKSGALITAGLARDQGREVFAVPGNIFSRASVGTNELIKRGGAKPVSCVGDILEELNLEMAQEQSRARQSIPPSEEEGRLLEHVSEEPVHIDEIVRRSGLPASEVAGILLALELKGLVRQVGSMSYVLTQ